MILRNVRDCIRKPAADRSLLAEVLHPGRDRTLPLRTSIAHACVLHGESTLPHRLMESTEVYWILSGKGRLHVGEEVCCVERGDSVLIPPGSIQYIENTGEDSLEFLAIVDPAWREEDEMIQIQGGTPIPDPGDGADGSGGREP